jgi:hypothetical protein
LREETRVFNQSLTRVPFKSLVSLLVIAPILTSALSAQPLPSGSPMQVNTKPTSDDGRFTVIWKGDGQGRSRPDTPGRRLGTLSAKTSETFMWVFPVGVAVDAYAREGTVSNSNGVLEPGEFVVVETTWGGYAVGGPPIPSVIHGVSGTLSNFTGPAGGVYSLVDQSATYAAIYDLGTGDCSNGSAAECYVLSVAAAGKRPSTHWDATVQEDLSGGDWPMVTGPTVWTIHIGESFPDVPTGNQFYNFIETVFHDGVTAGCSGGGYCPGAPVTRAQMAVFLLKSKLGSDHVPPPCTGTVFTDVPCAGGPFDPWIEELAGLGITGGCGGTLYCPGDAVTREQMAAFLLKTREGSAYVPPACTGIFEDVPCTPGMGFSDWIEDLRDRQITGGCSASPSLYCPTSPNNRGQMAVFLVKTFGLVLDGS